MQWIPETAKEPFRSIVGKPHPFGLPHSERCRLERLPRYQPTSVQLFNRTIKIVDAASFLASHREVFQEDIYRFECDHSPVIIDAGANVGLASIFFHRIFPDANITAFESDPTIHSVLKENLLSFGIENAEAIHGAIWDSEENLSFAADSADAGRVSEEGSVTVPGVRLRTLLQAEKIDFLKMDIEGAETRVLTDCEGALENVDRMFVEYHSVNGPPQDLSHLLGILERTGFRYYIEHTGLKSCAPFIRREVEAGFDLQLNIFASRSAS